MHNLSWRTRCKGNNYWRRATTKKMILFLKNHPYTIFERIKNIIILFTFFLILILFLLYVIFLYFLQDYLKQFFIYQKINEIILMTQILEDQLIVLRLLNNLL